MTKLLELLNKQPCHKGFFTIQDQFRQIMTQMLQLGNSIILCNNKLTDDMSKIFTLLNAIKA